MILDSDLTFVIQGEVQKKQLSKNLNSIRYYYPRSKIVLSTWESSFTNEYDVDLIVKSEDPGSCGEYFRNVSKNNCNRQIISSRAGLRKVNTKYAIKSRADNYFTNSSIPHIIEIAEGLQLNSAISRNTSRLIIPSNLTLHPEKKIPLLFHPSDFLIIGQAREVLEYFDAPIYNYEALNKLEGSVGEVLHGFVPKFTNEQYLFINYLNKIGKNVFFKNAFDRSFLLIEECKKLYSNVFFMCHSNNIGFNNTKYPQNFLTRADHTFTEIEWLKLYNTFVSQELPTGIDVEMYSRRLFYPVNVFVRLLKRIKK